MIHEKTYPIIIIPARMQSQRLPGKPLLKIAGKTMIEHVWQRACSFNLGPVIVACAESEIAEVITKSGGHAILTDPNLPSGTDRIQQALTKFEDHEKYNFVINLQGDLPLIEKQALQSLVDIAETSECDITTLASRIHTEDELKNPNIVKISAQKLNESEFYKAHYFSRSPIPYSQNVNPEIHFHHIGLYGYRRKVLEEIVQLPQSPLEKTERLEQLRALDNGYKINFALHPNEIVGVDTQEDYEKVRSLFENV